MVEIDLRTSPMHSNKTNTSATKNSYPNSMMTPDMLEVLGLSEMHKAYSFHPEKPRKKEIDEKTKRKENIASTSSGKKAVVLTSRRSSIEAAPQEERYISQDIQTTRREKTTRDGQNTRKEPTREGETTREEKASIERKASKKTNSVRYMNTPSCLFYGDNDDKSLTESIETSSTCSDDSYYEPLPQDPFDPCDVYYPCQDDWTFAEGYDCSYERENKSSSKNRCDSFTTDSCDPLALLGMVLTMPLACGLLCVDNVFDTNYFESASKTWKNITCDKSISDKPEFLVIEDKRSRKRGNANNDLVA